MENCGERDHRREKTRDEYKITASKWVNRATKSYEVRGKEKVEYIWETGEEGLRGGNNIEEQKMNGLNM